MSSGNCPKCHGEIKPFGDSLWLFPFRWHCPHCKTKLKLKSYRLLNIALIVYLLLMIAAVIYIPIIRQYGISVVLSVFGWMALYRFIAQWVFHKNNVRLA